MKINSSNYSGYLWYSNADMPKVYEGEKAFGIELEDGQNPFVAEGLLYDGKTSFAIKYIDGKYICTQYTICDLPNEFEIHTYLSNRMGNRKLVFRQYWQPEADELCMNMQVLQPAECVFVGFEKKGE